MGEPEANVQSLEPSEAARRLDADEAQVIDVRDQAEWDAGRIPGSRHILLAELPARAESISKDLPVVFVCRGGSRSAMAAEAFRTSGYESYNLAGGLLAWAEEDLPLEPEDGHVAERGLS